jgi:precorrin-2 methylase
MAFAHGNEKHVMGTVTAVSDNSITVETMDKHQVTVNVVPGTKFMNGNAAAALTNLKVGDRVVIHAVEKDEHLQAQMVKIGAATAMAGHHHHKVR